MVSGATGPATRRLTDYRIDDTLIQALSGIFMRKLKPIWSYVSVGALICALIGVLEAYFKAEGSQNEALAITSTKIIETERRITDLEKSLVDQLQKSNQTSQEMVQEIRALRTDLSYYQKYGKIK
jgi:hypothetical protein